MNNYRTQPYDNRHSDTNQMHQLVTGSLGLNAYEAVSTISGNITWLYELQKQLPVLNKIASNMPAIIKVGQHDTTLYAIAESMPALQEIYCNLKTLVPLATKFSQSQKTHEEMLQKLTVLLGIISQDGIDSLLARYKEVDLKLADNEAKLRMIDVHDNDIATLNKVVAQSQATVAVLNAYLMENRSNLEYAAQLVEASERLGNDETLNKKTLEKLND